MKRVFAALVANLCLAMSASESNYFMGQINLADTIYQLNAFPMGVCSLTAATFTGLNYGVYTCDTNEQVTYQDYGGDSTCASDPTADPVTYSNTSLSEGELYSFNCDGDNNYQVADACTIAAQQGVNATLDGGEAVCCQAQGTSALSLASGGCLPYTSATGVCFPVLDDNNEPVLAEGLGVPLYSRTECDGVDTALELYATSECIGEPLSLAGEASVDSCPYSDTLSLDLLSVHLYRVLTSCVADQMELTNTTYCPPAPTSAPTMEPSAAGPTMEPTPANSDSGDSEDSEEEGDSAAALCFTLSAIVSMMAFLF